MMGSRFRRLSTLTSHFSLKRLRPNQRLNLNLWSHRILPNMSATDEKNITIVAEDFDDQTIKIDAWEQFRKMGFFGWQSKNPVQKPLEDNFLKKFCEVRNRPALSKFTKACFDRNDVVQVVASYSDHIESINRTWSDIGTEQNIPDIQNIMLIRPETCHMPFYMDSNGKRLENPDDVIKLLKECTSAKEVLKLIAKEPQEPKGSKKRARYHLGKLGKIVHLYYIYLHFQEKGYQVKKIILKDDLGEHEANTRRYWAMFMPVPFEFIHAPKGDDVGHIRKGFIAIGEDPEMHLRDETGPKKLVQCHGLFRENQAANKSNKDDSNQNTPEQSQPLMDNCSDFQHG